MSSRNELNGESDAPMSRSNSVLAEILPELEVVVGGRGIGEQRELAVAPVEFAALDDASRNDGAVPADELGCGVGDDVRAVLEWSA